MVQLREVPVACAGYKLDHMQQKTLVSGSLFALMPWATGNMPNVVRLGKLNMFYYVAMSANLFQLFIYICASGAHLIPFLVLNQAIFVPLILTCIWLYCRTTLGEAVPAVRNGKSILRMMIAAASNKPRPSVGIHRLQRQLAWLPAYDRRDVLTVKYVLDYMATQFSERVEKEDEDPFAVVPDLARLQGFLSRRSSTDDDARSSAGASSVAGGFLKMKTAQVQAVALSVYYNALLDESPGDKVEGLSLRKWFAAVNIHLFSDGDQATAVQDDELDDEESVQYNTREKYAMMKESVWLDANPKEASKHDSLVQMLRKGEKSLERKLSGVAHDMANAMHDVHSAIQDVHLHMPKRKSIKQRRSEFKERRKSVSSMPGMRVWELNQLGWSMMRGGSCSMQVPAGSMWLSDAVQTDWTLVDCIPMDRPNLRRWGVWMYASFALFVVSDAIIAAFLPWAETALVRGVENIMLYISWIPPFFLLVPTVILASLKFKADFAACQMAAKRAPGRGPNGEPIQRSCVPLPLRQSGKIEYGLLMAGFGPLFGFGLGYLNYDTYDSEDFGTIILYMSTFGILFIFCVYEALLALYHSAKAWCKHGEPNFASELASKHIEQECVVR